LQDLEGYVHKWKDTDRNGPEGPFKEVFSGDEKGHLKVARELRGDTPVNVKKRYTGGRKKMANGIGALCVVVFVENTGSPKAVADTLDLVRPRGRVGDRHLKASWRLVPSRLTAL
jgi:hypothetical protein